MILFVRSRSKSNRSRSGHNTLREAEEAGTLDHVRGHIGAPVRTVGVSRLFPGQDTRRGAGTGFQLLLIFPPCFRGLVSGGDPGLHQSLRVQRERGRQRADALVHDRLRHSRLVGLGMTVATITVKIEGGEVAAGGADGWF